MAGTEDGFLQYHEPDTISILVLISFFFFLSSLGWVFNKAIRAGLIGQILVGILYGAPVGNILDIEWQETFMALVSSFWIQFLPIRKQTYHVLSLYNKDFRGYMFEDWLWPPCGLLFALLAISYFLNSLTADSHCYRWSSGE